ncbi:MULTISPECIES: SURF1 family cytochrome oxidase biogenesis protein [unclassified Streptosporangium]|uniref:SURF1 family cytochrome oxidase biogenesis protein n=1 Tax=unclassified Streptosporangium TaxID=2632669 RepID=UPI002E2AF070|nr:MULTISPECIES: SURF1 family protein [unclassified Streptosporangium]
MPTLDDVYRFLLTPRWLALHVVVLLVIPAFVLLGQWQFGRFEERSTSSDQITGNLRAAPVSVERLTSPGGTVPTQDKYRTVTAKGTYDASAQFLVRRRVQDRAVGFYVLTPLVTANGTGVLVNRGWVKAGSTADALPEVPAPSSGEVTVTGRLRPAETEETSGIRDRAGLPAGQVLLINTEAIGRRLPYGLLGGYVELTGQSPAAAAAPAPVPAPDVGEGGGLNLAYGVQWWLFIGVAIGGWALLIRREAADLKAAASAPAATGGPDPGAPSGRDESGKPGESPDTAPRATTAPTAAPAERAGS